MMHTEHDINILAINSTSCRHQ